MLKNISKDYNNETEAIEAIEYSMANGTHAKTNGSYNSTHSIKALKGA